MNLDMSPEAQELAAAVADALAGAGGVDLVRRAERDPASRRSLYEPVLDPFGVWDIAPHEDPVQLEAAAAVARAAGWNAAAYPVVERLARPEGADGLLLVPRSGRMVAAHADLDFAWRGADLLGNASDITSNGTALGTKLAPFVGAFEASPTRVTLIPETALLITLQSWWLLGLLGRALSDVRQYVKERQQFGRPLAKFQNVQFTLADATVEANALEELAKYTAWSLATADRSDSWLTDALALRVASLQASEKVLRAGHQLHGAMGFADETNQSYLSRVSQSVRRLPEGAAQTSELLVSLIEEGRFTSPFMNTGHALASQQG